MSATAAKLPAAAITMSICGGASRRTRLARKSASPPPSAMRGASGPITAPRPIEARAARMTPGRSIGRVRPALRPSAGTWPPFPGSRTMAKAVISPAMARTGRDHQTGVLSKPSVPGQIVVHADLDPVDGLQEPPGHEGDHHAHDRRDHEEDHEPPAAKDRGRVKGRRCGGVAHSGLPAASQRTGTRRRTSRIARTAIATMTATRTTPSTIVRTAASPVADGRDRATPWSRRRTLPSA